MDFLSQPLWWVMLLGASIMFGIYCGLGRKGTKNPVGKVSRTGFVALVAGGFILIGWQAGLVGLLLALFVGRIMVNPLSTTPARPVLRTRASSMLGRRAILQDMMTSGVSREKVWGLIRQGSLIAYEDPHDRRISPNPPKDTDGRREDSGRVGEGATGEMAGLHWGRLEVGGRSSVAA